MSQQGDQDPTAADNAQPTATPVGGLTRPPLRDTKAAPKKTAVKKKGGGSGKAGEKKKRRRKSSSASYSRYIYKVLKQVHPEMGLSKMAMAVMESMMADTFERLAGEAHRLCLTKSSGKQTLSSRDIQGAVRLVMPGELARHAISEGTKALAKTAASKAAKATSSAAAASQDY